MNQFPLTDTHWWYMHMPMRAYRDFSNEKAQYEDLPITVSGPKAQFFINSLSSNPRETLEKNICVK